MADDKSMRAAGETPVCDQGNILAQSSPHDSTRGREHFAHAGTAAWPLVADDNHIPFLDFVSKNGLKGFFLGFKNAGTPAEFLALLAADFCYGTLRRQVTLEDHKVAVLFDRILDGANNLLALRIWFKWSQVLLECFPSDSQAIAMEQALGEEGFHEWHDAADGYQLGHEKTPAGLQVCKHWHALTNAGEILEGEFDFGRVSNGEEVKNGVRRASQGNDHRDGIFEGFLGNDIRGKDATLEHVENSGAGISTILCLLRRNGILRGTIRETEAHRLDGGGHRVGRIHTTARARAGYGIGLHIVEFFFRNFIGRTLTDSFKDRDNIQLTLSKAAWEYGATVNKYSCAIQTENRHDAAGHIFVAATDRYETVKALAAHNSLNRIRDDLARNEGVFHPLGAHRDTIRNRNGVENRRLAAGGIDSQSGFARELIDMHVAGSHHAPCRGNAYLRL